MNTEQVFNQNPWLRKHHEAINTITRWSDVSPVFVIENLARKCSARRLDHYSQLHLHHAI